MLLSEDGSPGRKDWIDLRLKELDRIFAISVGGFSIMDNHLHFLLRIDVEQASQRQYGDTHKLSRYDFLNAQLIGK